MIFDLFLGVHFSGMQMMSENQRLDGRALPLQSIQHTSDRLTPLKQSKNPRHNKESDENDNVITNTGNRYSQRTDDSGIEVSNNTSTISGENVNSTVCD